MVAVEPFVTACSGVARQRGQPLPAAYGLNVAVENIVGARNRGNPAADFNFVGVVWGWFTVLFQQTRNDLGCWATPVTGVTGDRFPSAKQGLVDRVDNLNHPARGQLHRNVIRILRPIAQNIAAMAIRAIVAQGRGKEPHRLHELVDRDAFEHLNVLEDILRHEWLLLRCRLAARRQ